MLDELHHGDFVMEQLVLALRSTAFFESQPGACGFRLDNRGGRYPQDELSWVTSGTAFLPPDSVLAHGLYRLVVSIEDNQDGDPAVTIRALPHLAETDPDEVDPWHVSTRVKGIDCRWYNFEDEYWEEDWEDTNSIPSLLEIKLFMDPIEKYGDPVTLERIVEIPVSPGVTEAVTQNEAPAQDTGSEGSSTAVSPGISQGTAQ